MQQRSSRGWFNGPKRLWRNSTISTTDIRRCSSVKLAWMKRLGTTISSLNPQGTEGEISLQRVFPTECFLPNYCQLIFRVINMYFHVMMVWVEYFWDRWPFTIRSSLYFHCTCCTEWCTTYMYVQFWVLHNCFDAVILDSMKKGRILLWPTLPLPRPHHPLPLQPAPRGVASWVPRVGRDLSPVSLQQNRVHTRRSPERGLIRHPPRLGKRKRCVCVCVIFVKYFMLLIPLSLSHFLSLSPLSLYPGWLVSTASRG